MQRTATLVLAAFAATLLSSRPVHAQSTFGAVVGVIADASEGVLPNATLTLLEVQTGVSRTSASRDNGAYEFLNLTQGIYRIEVSLAGFATNTSQPFPVEARRTVRVDVVLQMSGVAETVVVRNVAPLINTETPTISDATSNRELQELPFTFRTQNTSPIPAIQTIAEVQRARQEFSLSGSLPYQNDVSVDGVLTTSLRWNGIGDDAFNNFPSIESIQEIKVSSVNNTAEFAQLGDITTVSRPGTNTLHGTAFWNFNTTALNANPNYFDRDIEADKSDNYNFGASLGGPLARNRTFFFGTFERLDITRAQSTTATVPAALLRGGNFSSLSTALIDPATGRPFPGNVIPQSRINAVAARLLQDFIPLPNEGSSTYRHAVDASEESNQFDIRIDQNFNQGHTLFGRVSWKRVEAVSPTRFESLGPRNDMTPARTMAISDNYALSASLLNEARFGFTSVAQRSRTRRQGRDVVSALGLRLLAPSLPEITGTPSVFISGLTKFGEALESPLTEDTWQVTDNLTWARNAHTFKGGFDAKRFNWTSPVIFTGSDEFGAFFFNNNIQGGGTGNALANFLLGIPTDVDQTQAGPGIDAVATHYGAFVQDDWRMNRSVTVSAGVRYDLHEPFQDRDGNISNFLRDTPNGDVVVPDAASRALTAPGFAESIGNSRILTAGEAGLPKALRRTDVNNVAPRLGIAWRPNGDTTTVIRAGYGVYYTRVLGQMLYSLTGIHTSDNMTFSNQFDPVTRTYSIVWPNTFAGEAYRGATRVGTQNFTTANDPDYKDPQTQQWSVTFERELDPTNALRVSYSGFRSMNLTMAPDLNQLQPNTIGFQNLPRETRPYPNWNHITTRDNGGYHRYHDVVLQLRGELPRAGLAHVFSYKWAHSIDNIDRGDQSGFQVEINGRTDNRFDPDYLRGKTANIPDHRFVSSLIWKVPVGRERALASQMPRAVEAIAGGWTLSSVVDIESGPHLTPYYSSHCASGTFCYGPEKADAVSGQDPNAGPRTLDQWFNTAAFSDRAFFSNGFPIFTGRFGDAPKGSITGPGAWNVDFAAFKDVRLTGAAMFRVSVLVTNLFNHANWGRPDTDLSSSTYGSISELNPLFPLRTIVIGARVTY